MATVAVNPTGESNFAIFSAQALLMRSVRTTKVHKGIPETSHMIQFLIHISTNSQFKSLQVYKQGEHMITEVCNESRGSLNSNLHYTTGQNLLGYCCGISLLDSDCQYNADISRNRTSNFCITILPSSRAARELSGVGSSLNRSSRTRRSSGRKPARSLDPKKKSTSRRIRLLDC